jgi:hypothetical protein
MVPKASDATSPDRMPMPAPPTTSSGRWAP